MLVAQVFFHKNAHAFHLYLYVDYKGENILMSTVPKCLLEKYFPNTMASIKYAHVSSAFSGDKLLQMLSEKILLKKELHAFFYPDYLLAGSRATLELAEKVIKLQDVMHIRPNSYYTQKTDSIKFFVLNQIYLRKKRHILRSARFISKEDFDYNYIFTPQMRLEFETLQQKNSLYIELMEDCGVEYVLLLNSERELLMFVSV